MSFKEEFERVQAAGAEANAEQARKRKQQAEAERKRRAGERADTSTAEQRTQTAAERSGDDAEIARLAALPQVTYDRERKAAADLLGVRASSLDRLVREQRAKLGLNDGEAGGLQGGVVSFPEPGAWHEPVNGAALLDEIAAAIRRHVAMTDHARDACALWTVHTHALDQFFITPRLCVRSPVKGCGKTTLLDILARLVLRPLPTANVSVSALFRVVEAHRPTLLVDEADTFLATADELRGVLNSGHRKGGAVLRTVGDDHEPRSFRTFSACAIALIGALPGTLHDRSVVIDLKRRLPTETIAAFRPDRAGALDELARKAARWAADNAVALGASDPAMPDGIINRAADNWRALLAIAELAGGDWPDRARKAAIAAHDGDEDEASRLELVLGDLRDIFGEAEDKPSAELVKALAEIEGRPWSEYGKTGKPISQNALARLLKRVSIAPQQIGPEGARVRGYVRAHLEDAFARYLSAEGDHNRPSVQNPAKSGTSDISQPSSREGGGTDGKCKKPNNDGFLDGWTVGMGEAPVCAQCGRAGSHTNPLKAWPFRGTTVVLHEGCEHAFVDRHRD